MVTLSINKLSLFLYVKFEAISWKIDILSITVSLKFEFENSSAPMWHMYDCDYLLHTTFCFFLIDFQLNTYSPSQFCGFFTIKSPSIIQRSVSQENA